MTISSAKIRDLSPQHPSGCPSLTLFCKVYIPCELVFVQIIHEHFAAGLWTNQQFIDERYHINFYHVHLGILQSEHIDKIGIYIIYTRSYILWLGRKHLILFDLSVITIFINIKPMLLQQTYIIRCNIMCTSYAHFI